MPEKKKAHFDFSVSLGDVLQIIALGGGLAVAYVDIRAEMAATKTLLAAHEKHLDKIDARADGMQATINDFWRYFR